jgi:hypothetical protein
MIATDIDLSIRLSVVPVLPVRLFVDGQAGYGRSGYADQQKQTQYLFSNREHSQSFPYKTRSIPSRPTELPTGITYT